MKSDALQTAIYSKLTGDATLMALITGVYADVEQPNLPEADSVFPYVTIGNDQITAWDNKTLNGASAICQIDVWSRSNNLIEAKAIGSAIHGALHHTALTITGASHIITMIESETYTKDPDGHTKRGLILARVLYDNL